MSIELNIKPEQYFRLQNGRVLKSLYELINALESMDEYCFNHHVTSEKNDFASWIRHVFKDEKLADSVSLISDRESTAKIIEKHIFEESQKSFRQISEVKRTIEHKNEIVREKQKESEPLRQKIIRKEKEQQIQKNIQAQKEIQKAKEPKVEEYRQPAKDSQKIIHQNSVQEAKYPSKPSDEFSQKLTEILSKEREIELREKKIEQIESHIESELEKLSERKSNPEHPSKFFTKEFSQGLSIGFLIALVACLIYFKFFM